MTTNTAEQLLNECLTAFENLSPHRRQVKGVCYGAFPNADDCPCTACRVRRYLKACGLETA